MESLIQEIRHYRRQTGITFGLLIVMIWKQYRSEEFGYPVNERGNGYAGF